MNLTHWLKKTLASPAFALSLTTASLGATLGGCSTLGTHVASEDASLGRVVVYRSGIAYFERRAHVNGDLLNMRVPHDKVDDFLKSLTVADATSGKAYPVSFPTRAATSDGTVEMTIQLPQKGSHDLILSYITDAPAWKPSYRVVVGEDGKVTLQGWAVVDNTSGEDWTKVKLGVGASSAMSFRYDLRTVRNVYRQQLQMQETFAKAPPMGGSTHTEKEKGIRTLAELGDGEIPREPGHPDLKPADQPVSVAAEERGPRGTAIKARPRGDLHKDAKVTTGAKQPASQQYRPPATKPSTDDTKVRQIVDQLRKTDGTVVIEGYSDKNERDQAARGLDRANTLRNQLIQKGVAPARLQVVTRGAVDGRGAGVRLVLDASKAAQEKAQAGQDENGDPIGQSHFESNSPMTVVRGTSAMVSVVHDKTAGEVVYLFDAESERGSSQFAFRSVRLKNPTEWTLEGGPVTVYGQNRFIGEGLSESIPPHATAVVPFALDRQVVVSKEGSEEDRISRLVTLQRGVLTAEVSHARKTKVKLTSRLEKATKVYVRHSVRKGWTLTKSPEKFEKLGESYLFEVALDAGETKTIEISEATPLVRTLDLRSATGIDLVRVWLETPRDDTRFTEPMKKLLAIHKEIADIQQGIQTENERMGSYRERMDELHAQIVSLKAFKAGGSLMRSLEDKLREMSDRVQRSTLNVADMQQKLMLARIKFQDGVAELSMDARVAAAAPAPAATR